MSYDLGYFEGIRNVFMYYAQIRNDEDLESFKNWLAEELADAKRCKEESERMGF